MNTLFGQLLPAYTGHDSKLPISQVAEPAEQTKIRGSIFFLCSVEKQRLGTKVIGSGNRYLFHPVVTCGKSKRSSTGRAASFRTQPCFQVKFSNHGLKTEGGITNEVNKFFINSSGKGGKIYVTYSLMECALGCPCVLRFNIDAKGRGVV